MKNRHQEKKSLRKISKQNLENIVGGNRDIREIINPDEFRQRFRDLVNRFHRR